MSKCILIIDDSESVRIQVRKALEPHGYACKEAVNGLDGAEQIEAGEGIDGVVCDINMPKMSGIEMLARIEPSGISRRIPIIMLTTEGSPKLIRQAKALGIKGWLVKPFDPQQLVDVIDAFTRAA